MAVSQLNYARFRKFPDKVPWDSDITGSKGENSLDAVTPGPGPGQPSVPYIPPASVCNTVLIRFVAIPKQWLGGDTWRWQALQARKGALWSA